MTTKEAFDNVADSLRELRVAVVDSLPAWIPRVYYRGVSWLERRLR